MPESVPACCDEADCHRSQPLLLGRTAGRTWYVITSHDPVPDQSDAIYEQTKHVLPWDTQIQLESMRRCQRLVERFDDGEDPHALLTLLKDGQEL